MYLINPFTCHQDKCSVFISLLFVLRATFSRGQATPGFVLRDPSCSAWLSGIKPGLAASGQAPYPLYYPPETKLFRVKCVSRLASRVIHVSASCAIHSGSETCSCLFWRPRLVIILPDKAGWALTAMPARVRVARLTLAPVHDLQDV